MLNSMSHHISIKKFFLSTEKNKSQKNLDKLSEWTTQNEMKLNPEKNKYMIINFCKSTQFNTRLSVNKSIIDQVREVKLLGVIISEDLTWSANTNLIVKRSYQRMCILRKLYEFKVSYSDLKHIYILYIRSLVEQSCVVWSTSLTQEDERKIERVQKIALRIIFKEKYISYENVLSLAELPTLKERRLKVSLTLLRNAHKVIKPVLCLH